MAMTTLYELRATPCPLCEEEEAAELCEAHALAIPSRRAHCQIESFTPIPVPDGAAAATVAKKALIDEFSGAEELAREIFGDESLRFSVFIAYPEGGGSEIAVALDFYDIERKLYDSRTRRPTRGKLVDWRERIDWLSAEAV